MPNPFEKLNLRYLPNSDAAEDIKKKLVRQALTSGNAGDYLDVLKLFGMKELSNIEEQLTGRSMRQDLNTLVQTTTQMHCGVAIFPKPMGVRVGRSKIAQTATFLQKCNTFVA